MRIIIKHIAVSLCLILGVLSFSSLAIPNSEALAEEARAHESGDETEQTIELVPGQRSAPYLRPKDAEYFWWDCNVEIKVGLRFADGSRTEASSEKNFSKRIEEVVFVNPRKEKVSVVLRTRY